MTNIVKWIKIRKLMKRKKKCVGKSKNHKRVNLNTDKSSKQGILTFENRKTLRVRKFKTVEIHREGCASVIIQ